MKYAILGLLLISLMFFGCTGGETPQNVTNDTTPPPPPPKPPSISIVSPTEGQVVMSPEDTMDVSLTISTQNLILKSPGTAAKYGEGYLKVTIDAESSKAVTSKTYLVSGLSIGAHTIKVEVMNNDRTSYSPAISKQVAFTIEKEKPKEYVPVDYTVSITDKAYEPASITVKVGDRVTWVNKGNMPQTATCFIGGKKVFDTQTLASGKNATITMSEMFECDYYSSMFRVVTGKIKVESNGSAVQ